MSSCWRRTARQRAKKVSIASPSASAMSVRRWSCSCAMASIAVSMASRLVNAISRHISGSDAAIRVISLKRTPAMLHRRQRMISKHRCQGVGHHMRYMATGRQCRVVICHGHMGDACARGGPQPLYRLECRRIGVARGRQNDLAPIKELRIAARHRCFRYPRWVPGHKPWVVGARSLNNDAFNAGHIRDHGLSEANARSNTSATVAPWPPVGTDDDDIGLGNDGRQVQTETINEPQSQPALKRVHADPRQ